MKLPRYIPKEYMRYAPNLPGYPVDMFECYIHSFIPATNGQVKHAAIFYIGKQAKPSWHYTFLSEDDMKKRINDSISSLMNWEDRKTERKQSRKHAVSSVAVGQLYAYSWGYDQTNVDFYQIVEVKGASFVMREIRGKSLGGAPSGDMSDYVCAVPDSFVGDPIRKTSLSMDFGCLALTTPEKKHFRSWYA